MSCSRNTPPPLPRRLYSSDVCRALVPVGLSSLVFSSSLYIWQTPHFHDAIHYASLCIFVRMHIQRLTHVEQDGVQQENLLGCGALPHPGSFCTSAMRAPRRAYGPAKTSNLLTYSGMLSLFLPFLLYFFLCLNFLHFSPLLPSTFYNQISPFFDGTEKMVAINWMSLHPKDFLAW